MWRKCGKPNCQCAQPGHRGHGPQYNLTRRIGGKTVNVHLKPGPELEKAEREVAEHQRFEFLVEEVSQVSEAICASRPVTAGTAPPPAEGEGELAAQLEEIAAAEITGLAGLAASMLGSGRTLGVLEQAMRTALSFGSAPGCWRRCWYGENGYAGPHVKCGNGHQAVYAGVRDKTSSPPCSARSRCAGPGITAASAVTGWRPGMSGSAW